MQKNRILKLLSLSLLVPFASQAKLVTITLTHAATCTITGGIDCSAQYQTALTDLLASFESNVNAQAGTGDLDLGSYFGGLANSTTVANSGLGASYYNNYDYFSLGAGVGASGSLAPGVTISDLVSAAAPGGSGVRGKLSGVGAASSITFGANAGLLFKSPWFWGLVDPTRLKGTLGLFFFPFNMAGLGSASVTSVSAMGQYQILPSVSYGLGAFKWNGVNVSTGLRFAKFSVSGHYAQDVNQTQQANINGSNVSINMDTPLDVTLDINTTTFTIPFEASTSVRLAYFLNLMVGTAFDMNVGSASGGVTVPNTNTSIVESNTSSVTFTNGPSTASTTIDPSFAQGSGHPTFLNWRAFTGLGVEFGVGNIFVTLQKAVLKPQYGVNVGFSLFY